MRQVGGFADQIRKLRDLNAKSKTAKGGFSFDEYFGNTNKSARQTAYNNASRRNQKIMARNDPSLGGAKSTRGAIVAKCMRDRGCSLGEASRYVKEHGLY
jgi:hypothetical protein